MKSPLNPVVVAVVLVVVIAVVGFAVFKGSGGVNSGNGKLKSDLNTDAMNQKAMNDPEGFKKAVQESAAKGGFKPAGGTGP